MLNTSQPCSCIQALSFSADSMWLLSAGKDPEQNVVIWDVATCTALASGTTSQPVLALAWRSTTTLPAFVTLSKVSTDLYWSHAGSPSDYTLPLLLLHAQDGLPWYHVLSGGMSRIGSMHRCCPEPHLMQEQKLVISLGQPPR